MLSTVPLRTIADIEVKVASFVNIIGPCKMKPAPETLMLPPISMPVPLVAFNVNIGEVEPIFPPKIIKPLLVTTRLFVPSIVPVKVIGPAPIPVMATGCVRTTEPLKVAISIPVILPPKKMVEPEGDAVPENMVPPAMKFGGTGKHIVEGGIPALRISTRLVCRVVQSGSIRQGTQAVGSTPVMLIVPVAVILPAA